jgi:nitric oxide reductase NorQ protein
MHYTTLAAVDSLVKSVEETKVSRKIPKIKFKGNMVTLDKSFKVEKGLYEILKRNIQKGVSTLLVGETGCGKTEIVTHMANILELPIHIIDMGTMTDAVSGLVGIHTVTIVDGKTTSTFKKSRFSQIIQKPGIVLLDELSRASAQANNLLFPCLDFRRELPMEYCFEDQTPVKVHPKCVFIATANLGSQYTGTHKIDRALLDRFMTLKVTTPSSEHIKESLMASYSVPAVDIVTIVAIYDNLIKAHNQFKIDFKLSFRHLKFITEMVEDGFTIFDAFYSLCASLTNIEDTKILKDLLNINNTDTPDNDEEESEETEEGDVDDDRDEDYSDEGYHSHDEDEDEDEDDSEDETLDM